MVFPRFIQSPTETTSVSLTEERDRNHSLRQWFPVLFGCRGNICRQENKQILFSEVIVTYLESALFIRNTQNILRKKMKPTSELD